MVVELTDHDPVKQRTDGSITDRRTITWHSKEARQRFEPLLAKKSKLKWQAEFLDMLSPDTDRKVMMIHPHHSNRDLMFQRIGQAELHYRKVRDIKRFEGHSEAHEATTTSDAERMTYAVISPDEKYAEEAHKAETELDVEEKHRRMGELLGFPNCCIDALTERETDIDKLSLAARSPSAEMIADNEKHIQIPDFKPLSSSVWRNGGPKIHSHVPHSFECEETAELVGKRLELLAENGFAEEVKLYREWMDQPTVWHNNNGIQTIYNEYVTMVTSDTHRYSDERIVLGTVDDLPENIR